MPCPLWDNITTELKNNDREPFIYRYHSPYRPSLYFSKCVNEDGNDTPFLGFELEFNTVHHDIGRRDNLIDLIQTSNNIFGNNTFIYYMRDRSIGYGLEMISQPATYNFYLNHADKIKQNLDNIIQHGFIAGYRCGFHIHFNKDYFEDEIDECTEKLLYLIDKFWNELVYCSRRQYKRIERWSKKYDEPPQEIVNDMKCGIFPDRYHALNVRNRSTLEFRLYASTLNFDNFLATLELTNNMIKCAKHLSMEEIENLSFDYFLTSNNLKEYYKKYSSHSRIKKYEKYLETK